MSKKRNLAVLMAAATVATSVAPVFAAEKLEVENVDEASLVAEVEKLLGTKYTNSTESGLPGTIAEEAYENSVYEIFNNDTGKTQIKTVNQLKTLIEKAKVNKETFELTVNDKGHVKDANGNIVATEKSSHSFYDAAAITALTDITGDDNKNIVELGGTATANGDDAVIVKLADNSEFELRAGDYVLDYTKPLDKNGNELNFDQAKGDDDTKKLIVGFAKKEGTEEKTKDIPTRIYSKLAFSATKTTVTYNLADLLTKEGYTATGADFVNELVKATNGTGTVVVNKNGKSYTIEYVKATDLGAVIANKGGYELKVNVKSTEESKSAVNYEYVIKGTSDEQKLLSDLRADLNGTAEVKAGKITKLAGEDRFATAVEISKDTFQDENKAESGKIKAGAAVLVGQDAIVDGLAASPLAAKEKAPVLLTQTKSVPASTMAEIKRTLGKDSTIYLIGGTNTIGEEVEKQLISELNAKIVRIAGEDRYDTSLEIADELVADSTTAPKAFVVGGNGEADAMSIAAHASIGGAAGTDYAPIIVTPSEGLTKAAKTLIKDKVATNAAVDVIGGETHVSTAVMNDIVELKTGVDKYTTERVAGSDRNVTNAKVIEKYYGSDVTKVYVAKDGYVGGNGQLIDALAVASVAGKDKSPIVLATNELTSKQSTVVKDATNNGDKKTLVQVGEGTAATVIDALVKLLKI
jgi:putative cell wall-binding protein